MNGVAGKKRRDPLVLIQQTFEAPREQIFDAWVQKDLLEQWFAPDGCTLHIARLDSGMTGYNKTLNQRSASAARYNTAPSVCAWFGSFARSQGFASVIILSTRATTDHAVSSALLNARLSKCIRN